ncbi:MAG: hypothetical protein R3Y44_07420 [Rikenellaceae bacterium]
MKKLVNLSVALFAIVAMASCSGAKSFGDMEEGFGTDAANQVDITCVPEVLVLNNGLVAAAVTVEFPADYFHKNVIAKATPVLVYESGELAGSSIYFQGVNVDDNYTVVTDAGGSYTSNFMFPYSEEMKLSDLQIRLELKNAKKEKYGYYTVNLNTGELLTSSEDAIVAEDTTEATAIKSACGLVIAKGINTLQQDLCFAELMDVMANDYKAVTYEEVSKANVKYAINSSSVKSSSLTDAQIAAFKEVVEATKDNESATQSISANGYASPDGPEKFNDKLSSARSESAKKAMDKFFTEMGLEADAAAYGEDWDGFKELVAASSIKDKNLILQVLSLYDSSVQREAEIKNLSSVYTELKSDILPELRRTQLVNNISIKGMSDEEMMALIADKKYAELTNEELLYLADSVIEDCKTKIDVLKYTAKKYNDARAYNNLGIILAKKGDAEASLDAFEMATRNGASDATINKNLLLSNLDNNNYAEAKKYTGDKECAYVLAAVEGDYTPAARNLDGCNGAIANIMNKNYGAAKKALGNCECPKINYLRAVIASAEGEVEAGISFIKKAVEAKPELAEKAKSDINLANLFEGGLVL